ncbi:S-adenosyl-L-methionine-dependent methyltransferase [Chiua virens]|nr:S-adenosyl-L-methionine-dependent methyltransferase [Chiua virens]
MSTNFNNQIVRPSRRGARPSAYSVSFPDDAYDSATTSDASSSSRKRDRGDAVDADLEVGVKRPRNLDATPWPVPKYESREYEVLETPDLLIFGEENDLADDENKPFRKLSHFTFFDSRQGNKMVTLDPLDAEDGDHHILGAGFVVAKYEVDEDEGQEDGLDFDEPQYVRLSRIIRYFTKYWEADSPFLIETEHAIYELDVLNPSKRYRSTFRPYWRVQTILRHVISSAADNGQQEFEDFKREYQRVEVFGKYMTETELWDAAGKLRETLETVPNGDDLRASEVVHRLLFGQRPVMFKPPAKSKEETGSKKRIVRIDYTDYNGDVDREVLRKQNGTHVTRRIGELADGLFRDIWIVAPRRRPESEESKDGIFLRLIGFLERTQKRRRVQFRPEQRIGRSRWLKYIIIDDLKYEIGDTVLFYPGKDVPPNAADLPPSDTLADHFWFARIIQIHEGDETVHVQWFEHSSKTLLQELGNTRELFLTNTCDTQKLNLIIGKVEVRYIKPGQSLEDVRAHDFFYRYMWSRSNGTFKNADVDALTASGQKPPPDYCPVCDLHHEYEERAEVAKIHRGIRLQGIEYHIDDFVLIKADEGPCHIGQIIRFMHGRGHAEVVTRLLGRTDKVGSRPDTLLKDERHLFYTNDEMTTPVEALLGVCFVVVKGEMPDLDQWLSMSPHHFYLKYRFPSLGVRSWNDKHRMRWDDLFACPMCMKKELKKFHGMKKFLREEKPLRVFDPFAGTGAFAMALEEVGCFKLTHAAEISPSAAKTLRKNTSPDVEVYNQCTNLVLSQAILTHEGKNPDPLVSIEGEQLPLPPKPGDIDCLIAGFPCQPHSTLNMFQKANDRKSNLILTTLSFVDFLKPPYCIFENVRGFLQYNLRARQASKHAVKGGIPMGGLKFVVAALLDMGKVHPRWLGCCILMSISVRYQVRCGLLQAGHYGTPQTRVRFFLIAAKRGLVLPPLPQPSHDFPVADALEIKFPDGITLNPIITIPGVALHGYVSIHDAISDLPKFEWKHPNKVLSRRQMEEHRVKECRDKDAWCGYDGSDVEYEHEPCTTFQARCRIRPTRDIQQYTRTYDAKKVERVVEIPVKADADYRSLRPDLWEWQFANPASAVARTGFRAGLYGRIQRDGWFQTTVTNVDPTAKQSRVIHYKSRRIVTVRELARSQGFPDHFVFHANKNNVVTMHRLVGNAVPWLVSAAIGREFRDTLYEEWVKTHPESEFEGSMENGDSDAMDVD